MKIQARAKQAERIQSERGVALMLALLTVIALSALVAAIHLVAQSEVLASTNYKVLTQAHSAAEAGIERTVEWFEYTYPTFSPSASDFNFDCYPVVPAGDTCGGGSPVVLSGITGVSSNYPVAAVQTSFNGALNNQTLSEGSFQSNFSVSATLLRVEQVTAYPAGMQELVTTWEVTSEGQVGGQASVESKAVIERGTRTFVRYAVATTSTNCPAIDLGGGAFTDRYDSSNGPYGVGNQFNDGASVGSNGSVDTGGGAQINGGAALAPNPPNPCAPGSPNATEGVRTLPEALTYPPPSPPSPLPPTGNHRCPGVSPPAGGTPCPTPVLVPGSYGDLDVRAPLTLTGGPPEGPPAEYTINSLDISSGDTITITGPVILNFAGSGLSGPAKVIKMTGGAQFLNPSGQSSNLMIFYAGTQPIDMAGGAQSAGMVYAPNAHLDLTGGTEWFGSIISSTFRATGGSGLHYDGMLEEEVVELEGWVILAFNESKF